MIKMPVLIAIPMIAVFIVVITAMVIRVGSPKSPQSQAPTVSVKPNVFPDPVTKSGEVAKPAAFLGSLFGKTPAPTPTPDSAADLSKELKNTYDDGGQSELDELEKEMNGI